MCTHQIFYLYILFLFHERIYLSEDFCHTVASSFHSINNFRSQLILSNKVKINQSDIFTERYTEIPLKYVELMVFNEEKSQVEDYRKGHFLQFTDDNYL